jgi:hypothetical protein
LADEPGDTHGFTENYAALPGLDGFVVRGQQPVAQPEVPGYGIDEAPVCCPRWAIHGEFLYLRPGNDKVAFAVPINGAIVPPVGAPPVQVGPEVLVDTGFSPGFRVGGDWIYSQCSALGAEYTWFNGNRTNSATGTAAFPLRSLVNHPGSASAATDSLDATATSQISYQLADVLYRRALMRDETSSISLVGGVRYGHLGEQFRSTFTSSATVETVNTDVTFDGVGVRLGIEAEQETCRPGLLIYGKGYASFMGGQFSGRYAQADSVRGAVVTTGWTEDRAVSLLETEFGVGWVSRCGGLRITAGYMFNGWFNVINTDDFIRAVRTSNSVNVRDSLSFDGLVLRAEGRF